MKVALRAAVTLVAVLSIALGAAASVRAADPSPAPTVGGTLSVSGRTVTVLSNGNVPANITLTATSVTLSETSFSLMPGKSHDVTFTGTPAGTVSALYSIVPVAGADTGSATLTIGLKPYTPPFDWSPFAIGGLAILALAFVARRIKPWRWRIVSI